MTPKPPPLTLAQTCEDLRTRVLELEELADFRERQVETVYESGYYEGFVAGMAAKVRYTDWGAD